MELNPETLKRFDVFLGQTKAFEDTGGANARIVCTASSDEVDLGVDRFMLSALETMRDAFPGMTIFLNHKYVIPEDVFGVVTKATIVTRGAFHDLDLEITVDTHNERAMMVYHQIQSGSKLGVSVGVLVTDAETASEVVDGKKMKVLNIKDVETLEASLVGIPANRRSWVQGALKAASYSATSGGEVMDEIINAPIPAESADLADLIAEALKGTPDNEEDPSGDGDESESEDDDDDADEESEDDDGDEDGEEEIEASASAAISDAPPVDGNVTIIVVQTEEEEEDDPEPDAEPDDMPSMSRIEAAQALRQKYTNSPVDRDWFTIKEAAPVEDGEEPPAEKVAEIFIYDAIGGDEWDDNAGGYVNSAKRFVDAVAAIDADRINIRLNSPGGVITDGMAMRNALTRHGAKLFTYVDGIAASMASVIATAGELTMEPGSMLMIHEPWGCQMGDSADMAREARVLNRYGDNIARIYAKKAGSGTTEEWRAVMRDEGWYGPEEAVVAGLADHVGNGTDVETKTKNAQFDDRFLALYKNAPDSIKGFFVKAIVPDKSASVEQTDTEFHEFAGNVISLGKAFEAASIENIELRKQIADFEKHGEQEVKDWEDANMVIRTILDGVDRMMDAPLPRKITPEASFTKIANDYPWLDERIVAQLARFTSEPNT